MCWIPNESQQMLLILSKGIVFKHAYPKLIWPGGYANYDSEHGVWFMPLFTKGP